MGLAQLGIAVVLVALAATPALAAEPVGDTLAWNLHDCVFVYGTATIPVARLADRMPSGFRPFAVNTVTAGQVTALGFEVDICAEGAGLDGQLAPMTYASTWAPVIAPPKHAVPGVGMFVNWDVLVPDVERRAVLQAAGTPAHDGAISISADLRQGDPLTPFTVDYDYAGAGAFHFDITSIAQPATGAGEFAQYTVGEAGRSGPLTYWRTEWAVQDGFSGVGTIRLDPDSWQAAAFGTDIVPARFTYGTWEYTNGKIVLPS